MSNDIFNMRSDKITSYIVFIFANSCMPTLLKTKPASMVCFHKKYIENTEYFFWVMNEECKKFNCCYEVLYDNRSAYYIMIYQTELLKKVLNRHSANPILKENGYRSGNDNLEYNLTHFKNRYGNFKEHKISEFPHELGIFLGYPIVDVEEYIKNKGENYILCGYWKVYDNAAEAGKIFKLFRKQREEAMELFFSGKELWK